VNESAREEALRLSIEAGLWECDSSSHNWRGHEQHIERLIALARQRSGWVWLRTETAEQMLADLLAAVPKPDPVESIDHLGSVG
jgi:hypothetical protein